MMVLCVEPRCRRVAEFRVAVRDDPWPLRYTCAEHLPTVVYAAQARTVVDYLRPGEATPAPREPEIPVHHAPATVTMTVDAYTEWKAMGEAVGPALDRIERDELFWRDQ
jgi:hypothetical protein